MSDVFECDWARSIHLDPNEPFKALNLVAYAMHLRMNGERAPGGKENWREWDRIATEYLMSVNDGER